MTALRVLVAEGGGMHHLADVIEADPRTELVAVAATGRQAIALTERIRPDAILLASNLLSMDVYATTREIMTVAPTPIVIAIEESGPAMDAVRVRARDAGALAAIPSPPPPTKSTFGIACKDLISTLQAMAAVGLVRRRPDRQPAALPVAAVPSGAVPFALRSVAPLARAMAPNAPSAVAAGGSNLIAIGASTGGPAALRGIIAAMPPNFGAPILITQHISHGFSEGMVYWLNSVGPLRVKLAEHGEALLNATIYVAPDDRHLTIGPDRTVELSDEPPVGGHRPSATAMFKSVAERYAAGAFAVILTGMGRDGVDGLEAVHRAGGMVCAQDEASCAVYGMPKAAIDAGIVDIVLPLGDIPRRITDAVAVS